MQTRSLHLLEFPKVLRLLAEGAVSEAGAARCLALAPLDDPARLAGEAELLREWLSWAGETDFALRPFPSLDGLLDTLVRPTEILDLDALWAVFQMLDAAREVREALADGAARWPLLAEAAQGPWPAMLWSGLRRCLGPDGNLRDEASPQLFQVRSEIRAIHQRCTVRVKAFIEREVLSQYLQEEFITVSSDRYVLPFKTSFKNKLPGIIHDYSQTGETCYFEPMFLVELNNELQQFKQEEREAEREVLRLLSGLLRQEREALGAAYDFAAAADVLGAKAAFAARFDARPVEVAPDAPLRLLGARHPLLAAAGAGAVPVDLLLEPGQRALVISGGNAGGKTVALKTLGLCAAMALAALPVCAREGSSLPAWGKLFVLLGDEQSIEDSLSTFTAQIRHLCAAWEAIDDGSLVIMDEFGAGTDPSQGAALAQAVVDGFLDKGSWLAVATHFPALKAYALSRERVRAASVLFDPKTKRPLYHLAYDQVGASQALDVAREHGLPEHLLARAQQYMLLDGSDTSAVLERLNALAVEREGELAALRTEQDRLRERRAKLQERFEAQRRRLLEDIQTRSREIMRAWREDKLGRKQAMKELAELRREAGGETAVPAPEGAPGPLDFEAVAPGGRYRHLGLGKTGTVAALDERKRQVKLDLGGVSVWAKPADLAPEEQPAGAGATPGPRAVAVPAGSSGGALVLDLRGVRAEEAEGQVCRFLDDAVLSGLAEVEIVHGRGTGALRKEVHRILRAFPGVDTFVLAPEDRGGDGMTIVELK
jgi:DNA mismatch repair protein MutS2